VCIISSCETLHVASRKCNKKLGCIFVNNHLAYVFGNGIKLMKLCVFLNVNYLTQFVGLM